MGLKEDSPKKKDERNNRWSMRKSLSAENKTEMLKKRVRNIGNENQMKLLKKIRKKK